MKSNAATFKFAFKKSLPILFGYLFLASAFGIMLYKAGYNWMWAIIISVIVYAGSGQFLLVSLIESGADLCHHGNDDGFYKHQAYVLRAFVYR